MKFMVGLILCYALSSLFAIVYAGDVQNLEECREYCIHRFIPLLPKFSDITAFYAEQATILQTSWPSCQSKCTRCAYKNSKIYMDGIARMFYHPDTKLPLPEVQIKTNTRSIEIDVYNCLNKWQEALDRNDYTSTF